jgi:hypothetical protein
MHCARVVRGEEGALTAELSFVSRGPSAALEQCWDEFSLFHMTRAMHDRDVLRIDEQPRNVCAVLVRCIWRSQILHDKLKVTNEQHRVNIFAH